MRWIMFVLFGMGAVVCCRNFYWSFLRYPLFRLAGGKREDYRWISPVPLIGSLFVAVSLRWLWQADWLLALAIILVLIDTGGLHWFAGSMLYYGLLKRATRAAEEPLEADDPMPPDKSQKEEDGAHPTQSTLR